MDNENGKVKFKVGVFTPKGQRMVLQIYKRTKCYIWIQFKGHPNCPDVYKKKICIYIDMIAYLFNIKLIS